ncbi:alpha/beta hydrolase [Curtobacterium sp. VKM Ac-2922]|uniref:alpha/beta hydrolase n=1 Tax=Curtobacterium sp. VKM Ac-2922 TaxID=2929475 RepID=UPI001FB46FDF|nr:alpha/beta hydrolase [Curtobacterium sp. VKM Ac-2922]MCJ1713148.1 alpha/beta hydrolase family protein [Curtobacterium sp. VKM Ac-2922]
MHSLGVVESSVLPGDTSSAVVHVPDTDRSDTPARSDDRASLDRLRAARGRGLLDALVAATPAQLSAADQDSRVVATAMDEPPSAAVVAAWWSGLDGRTQTRLARTAPVVVGCLDGVPVAVRDHANRTVLAAGLADPRTDASQRAMLGQVRDALHRAPGAPPKSLVTLDTRGAGRAAIAIGDLTTAADVTVLVPGMFFTVTGQMDDFIATAGDLYDEQATLAPVAAPASGTGVAVLAWLGYRTPDLSNVLSLGLADTGASRLERTVEGIRTLRDGDQPRLGIVAHSYGSTTALMALASGRMSADSLTVLGSPGSDVRRASELSVAAGQVYVGGAHLDPVAGSGYFGTDPAASSFGATVLDLAGGTVARADGDVFRRPVGHNDYLKPGTASLHDVALIAVGRGDLVRDALHHHGGDDGGDVQPSLDLYLVRPQDLQPRD